MTVMPSTDVSVYRAGRGTSSGAVDADPITTEVIRHGLNSAAEQMKRSLVRTAFSPVIYEVLDFAVAIYDRQVRMLAQAPALMIFMGTMNFCVEAAVAAVGGEDALEPGDIILYNYAYGTGSHAQDCAVVMPVFLNDEQLVGYTTIKGHYLDIGGKEPYSTDTVDIFQEGTIFPGVKLYRAGKLAPDIYRMLIANTRVPKMVAGDVNAEVIGVRTGAAALLRVIERVGIETFETSVERMYDHGESIVRSYFEKIPDGVYVGEGVMDDDGISDTQVPFELTLEVNGSDIRVDYSRVPDERGADQHAAAVDRLRDARRDSDARGRRRGAERGSLPADRSRDAAGGKPPCSTRCIRHRASSTRGRRSRRSRRSTTRSRRRCPGPCRPAVVATSGIARVAGQPRGHGRAVGRRCAAPGWSRRVAARRRRKLHHASRRVGHCFSPAEVWESKNPWLVEKVELREDSGGAGRYRGGSAPPALPHARGLVRHRRDRAHEKSTVAA